MREYQRILNEYNGLFSDGAPAGWSVASSGQDSWNIRFPNKQSISVDISVHGMQWDGDFDVDTPSTRLWHNSLRYLTDFCAMENGWVGIDFILSNFVDFLNSKCNDFSSLRSGSLDHQIALQLRTMCTLKAIVSQDNSCSAAIRKSLVAKFERIVDVNFKVAVDLDLLQNNNHGIMLGTALLHASTLFFELDADRVIFKKADQFLRTALDDIVDVDGFSGENTPTYQVFYVNLLGQLFKFFDWLGEYPEQSARYKSLTFLCEQAFRRLLLPDNAVPAIGDSPGGPQSTFGALSGRLFSPSNGIYINSSPNTHISIVCGFRSVIHKQLDDSSIRLWHAGQHLIADAGLLNYDFSDEKAVSLRSQRGHSGVFFTRFDDILPSKVVSFGKNTSRVKSKIFNQTNGFDVEQILCSSSFDSKYSVKREVSLMSPTRLRIIDTAHANDAETVVVRYLLDSSLNIRFEHNLIVCEGPKAWMTLLVNGYESLRLFHGHSREHPSGPPTQSLLPKGFISNSLHKIQATYLLEFTMRRGPDGYLPIDSEIKYGAGRFAPEVSLDLS